VLRERFQVIAKADRDAHQAFSVRVWRGLSWLERAETAGDSDSRFISLWIAFNAIYGHLAEAGRDVQDHASWQSFLARMVERDACDSLGRILTAQQAAVLRLIDNKFLFRPFWQNHPDAAEKLRRAVQRSLIDFRQGNTLALLQELFERLYVMRQQVFHGAATSGGKLNRASLETCTQLLAAIVPAMIETMIAAGPGVDWGEVCFPPVEQRL
jgi:hypothetical protein